MPNARRFSGSPTRRTGISSRTRVFIDSSVFIAAAISSRGYARDLVLRGIQGELDLHWSDLVLGESERNLNAKAPTAVTAFRRFQDRLNLTVVTPEPATIQRASAFVDPKDAPIVAAAIDAEARWLASYDRRHQLSQRESILSAFGITVATPDEILMALD